MRCGLKNEIGCVMCPNYKKCFPGMSDLFCGDLAEEGLLEFEKERRHKERISKIRQIVKEFKKRKEIQ